MALTYEFLVAAADFAEVTTTGTTTATVMSTTKAKVIRRQFLPTLGLQSMLISFPKCCAAPWYPFVESPLCWREFPNAVGL